jgi:hypothetical protein
VKAMALGPRNGAGSKSGGSTARPRNEASSHADLGVVEFQGTELKMSAPAKPLDQATKAAFKRARANVAKALAHPQVKAALRAQREAIERARGQRARKSA